MSPVSPVYYTVETVKIGLKTQLEWENPFHRIIRPCWLAEHSTPTTATAADTALV